jgi:hypothetical protein
MNACRTIQRLLFPVCLSLPLVLSGCSKPTTKPVTKPASDSKSAQTKTLTAAEQIAKVEGSGWYLPWYKRDPKHPDGPPIPVLIANAATGEITNHNSNPEIVMHHVQAVRITANQEDQVIVGKGGCTVTSLLNPADTVLTADTITWDSGNTKFVAEGHAHVVRRPRNGVPITQEGGKITYDLEKNTIDIE